MNFLLEIVALVPPSGLGPEGKFILGILLLVAAAGTGGDALRMIVRFAQRSEERKELGKAILYRCASCAVFLLCYSALR